MAQSNPGSITHEHDMHETRDPWAHRSLTMRCQTCMWWVRKESPSGADKLHLGRCRRHAPTLSGYPATFDSDWCGDHKLDEAKA